MGRSLLVMSLVRRPSQCARKLTAGLAAVLMGVVMAVPADLIVALWHPAPAPATAAAAVLLTPASPPAPVDPARTIVAQTSPGPTIFTSAKHIGTDTVWGPQASPYILLDDLLVDAGSTLTLLPGTVVKFGGSNAWADQFKVTGQLLSLGTPADPVIITSDRDDTAGGDSNGDGAATVAAAGDWWGISPLTNGTIVMDYTELRYAGYGSATSSYGAISVDDDNTTLLVSNSAIKESANSGVRFYSSTNSYAGFYNSFIGGQIGVASRQPTVRNVQLVNNVIPGAGSLPSLSFLSVDNFTVLRNDLGHGINASNYGGAPVTTSQLDVRYNLIGHGAELDIDSNASYSANWYGRAFDPGELPSCLTLAQKNARQDYPPYTWIQQPCGWTATGWQSNVVPALTTAPSRVPPVGISEVQAPTFGPVNTTTGSLTFQASDLSVLDAGKQLTATRTYRSDRTGSGDAGPGWSTAFSEGIAATGNTSMLTTSDGSNVPFDVDPAIGYIPALGINAQYQTGATGTTITTMSQTIYNFNGSGELTGMLLGDPGHTVDIDRSGGQLDKVTGVSGRYLDFVRSGGKLNSIRDGNGRSVGLSYADGRLTDVQGVDGQHERYEYDGSGRLTKVTAPSGLVTLAAQYLSDGKVEWIEQAGQGRTTFSYSPSQRRTTITRADGSTVVQTYDAYGQLVTEKQGGSTRHVVYNAGGGVIAAVTGLPDGPVTGYSPGASINYYDKNGDVVRHVDANNDRTATTYNNKHRPLVTTRPDGTTITRTYDGSGRLSTVTDPAGKVWTYTFNSRGQVTGRTDPLGRTASAAYQPDGDLDSTTDELGGTTAYSTDALGRQTSVTDALNHTQSVTYTAWNAPNTVTSPRGGVTTYEYNLDRRVTSVTDPVGGVTSYEYDGSGRPSATVDAEGGRTVTGYDTIGRATTQTDPLGHATTTAYTAEDWVASITDPAGKASNFEYDYSGRQYRVTNAAGAVTQTAYDSMGNATSVWSPDGARTQYAYNSLGQQTQLTTPTGKIWKTEYDAVGNVTKITDPLSHSTLSTFDEVGRVLTRTDRVGTVTTYVYDDAQRATAVSDTIGAVGSAKTDALGQVISQTDALGAVATTTYDEDGNVVATAGPAGNQTFEYDLAGRQTAAVDPLNRRTQTEYDHVGRVKRITYPDLTTRQYTYDTGGNLTETVDRTGAHWLNAYNNRDLMTTSTDPLGHATTFTYDDLGQQSTATDPTGVLQGTAYDPVGRVAVQWDTSGASWITAYDLDGNANRTTDPSGLVLNYTYDSLGNVKTIAAAGTSNFNSFTYDNVGKLLTTTLYPTTYTYDARGRTKTIKDGTNNTTTYDYDLANRRTTETSPLGHISRWTYDSAGRVKTTADALTNTTTYDYDAAGQLTAVTLPRGGVYGFTYNTDGRTHTQTDPLTKTTTYGYDAEGRPTSIGYPSGRSVTTAYDTAGRMTSTTAGTKTRTFGYDNAGRMQSATDPDTGTLQYAYNDRGLLSTVTDAFGATAYGYDVAQRLSSVTPPTGTATTYTYSFSSTRETVAVRGATNTDLLYDYAGKLRTRTPIAPSRTTGGSFQYNYDNAGRPTTFIGGAATYDADGRVTTTTDTLSGTTKTTTYGYDDADRLTSAIVAQGTTQLSSTSYQWDADSNRTSVTSGTTTTTAAFNLSDQLTSTSDGTAYSYDDDGRQIAAGSTASTYNGFGELSTAAGVAYGNDALGRLATRTTAAGTETFGYAGLDNTVNAWRRGTGATTHIVSDTHGGQLAFATDGAKTYRTGTNLHGDLVRLRDDFATATDWYASYDPFGTVTWTNATQPIPVPFGYQSDYTDPSTGNVDMGARNYNPGTASFTTSDTVVGSAANTATFNRYLYANANPLTYTDPDGHMALEEKDTGGTVTSTASSSKRNWGEIGCGIIRTDYCVHWFHKVQTGFEKDEVNWNPDDSGPSLAHDVLPNWLADFMDGATAETDKATMGTISTFRSGSTCQWGNTERCHDFDSLKTAQGWKDIAKGLYEPIEDCGKHPSWEGCGRAAFSALQILGIIDGGLGLAKGVKGLKGVRGAAAVEDASSVTSKASDTAAAGATEAGGATSRGLSSALAETLGKETGLADVARKLKAEAKTPGTKTPQGRRSTSGTGSCHSFAPATLVLMANGTTKAIQDIQIGDQVLATDPDSGQSNAKAVTALHKNDDADLADVILTDTSDKSVVLNTTWHHPFWNADTGTWTEAQGLKPGTHLLDADARTTITVTAVKTWTGLQLMRDLTVADIHTYYVMAGTTPVLVHNCGETDFVHASTTDSLNNIAQNGLNASDNVATMTANGTRSVSHGSFFTVKVGGTVSPLDAMEAALGWRPNANGWLVLRLPNSLVRELEGNGWLVHDAVPYQSYFRQEAYPAINAALEDGTASWVTGGPIWRQ